MLAPNHANSSSFSIARKIYKIYKNFQQVNSRYATQRLIHTACVSCCFVLTAHIANAIGTVHREARLRPAWLVSHDHSLLHTRTSGIQRSHHCLTITPNIFRLAHIL